MEIKTVVTGIVSLIIAVIVVALVAVPIVDDAISGTPYEGSNSDYTVRYTDFSGQAVTYTWAGSATVNGETSPTSSVATVVSDAFVLRPSSTGCYVYVQQTGYYETVHGTSEAITLTVTAEGAYTLTKGTTELATGNLTTLFISTTNGALGSYTGAIRATIGTTVYAYNFGSTSSNGPVRMTEFVDGAYAGDLFTPWVLSSGSVVAGPEITWDSIDYELVGEGQQVGKYGAQTLTFEDTTAEVTQWIAPIDFESASTENTRGINGSLLAVIPILLFVVAIMIAARLVREA